MGWETINVNDVEIVDLKETIPAGNYILQLVGAFENKKNPSDTDVLFKVADNGPYQGKSIYVDLPDPDRLAWSTQTYARIVKALGAAVEPFKQPKEVLTALASNGHSRLKADVYIRTFTRGDGSEGSANKVATRSFAPAA